MGLITICKKIQQRFKEDKPSIALKKMFYDFSTRERVRHFGENNPDKTIYIIRGFDYKSPFCVAPVHNLLANYFYVVSHIFYAKQNGWIPVVDQQNYPEYNTMDYPINGTMNSWEYYWKQPSDITLDEAYKSRNVVLSRRNFLSKWDLGYDVKNYYNHELIHSFNLISREIPLNDYTSDYISNAKQLFPKDKRILGVNVRTGGHSVNALNKGVGHPIQPRITELIEIVEKRMLEWNVDYVFLAADTEYAISVFKQALGDKLIYFPRQRAELGKEFCFDRDKSMYERSNLYKTTLNYLCEMELMVSCDSLIGSITSGFRYAVVRNDCEFSNIEVLDRGRF